MRDGAEASAAAPIEPPFRSGAFAGVQAHGLSGWVESEAASSVVTLMHGDNALLTTPLRADAAHEEGSGGARRLFNFDLTAAAEAAREGSGSDLAAPLRVVCGGAVLRGATSPLSASDLLGVAAIMRAADGTPTPRPVGSVSNALAVLERLAAGLRRNGLRRVFAFAITMMAREGVRNAARFAALSRAERQQWLFERRRAQQAAVDVVIAPARMELQELPSAADPFETMVFRNWPGDAASDVPLIGYQHFALARLRYPGALNTDAERQAGVMWYIENYSPFRHPFKVPFSGRQIAWLLAPADARAQAPIPRIVDWFLKLDAARADQDHQAWSPARIAYWWCLQRAVGLNIEHALLPESFIERLRAPLGDGLDPAPSCEFLRQHVALEPSFVIDLESSAGRLEAYVRLLMSEGGLRFVQFMPNGVLERIARLACAIALGVGARFDGPAARKRALEAIDYRKSCARIRSSGADLSATRLSQDWVAAAAGATAQAPTPVPHRAASSTLPFPVRVIGPLNSRSGLGQAARLSIVSLRAVGVEVETVDFLLDNPAPRGDYFPNAFDLSPGFGVNLLHLSGESLPLAAAFMAPEFFAGKANVGYFFWELPHPAVCHELALQQLDELWVASSFNREIYTPYLPHAVFRVGMALEPVRAPSESRAETRRRFDLPQSAFVFVTTFDSFSFISRKNPAASIRAFKSAFPLGSEDVRLVVKTHNLMRTLGEARADALRAEILRLCASDPRIMLNQRDVAACRPLDAQVRLRRLCVPAPQRGLGLRDDRVHAAGTAGHRHRLLWQSRLLYASDLMAGGL